MSLLRLLCVVLLCLLISCSKIDLAEAGYRNNIKEYDALIVRADPTLKVTLYDSKQLYQKDYDALPSGKAERIEPLTALNKRTDVELKRFDALVEASAKKQANANATAMKTYQAKFTGTWKGDGMSLSIEPNGKVVYERKTSGVSKSLQGASIKEFRRDSFDVGLLGMKTTFKIDKEPSETGGFWKMTIDGVELTRVAKP